MLLLFKLLCTPVLIGLAVLATRRWGPFVGGCIAGLPSISGPVSLFIALERGAPFAAAVAYNALLGVGAVGLFTLTYAWMAQRRPWYVALALAQGVFFAVGFVVGLLPHSMVLAVLVGLGGPPVTLWCMPRVPADMPVAPRPHTRWLVPVQMLLGAVLVGGITETAALLGAQWSGVMAFYPVMISILAPFCHATLGPHAARQLLAGLMTGFVGGTSFTVVVFFGVEALPLVWCYALATGTSLLLCLLVAVMQHKHARQPL